ncbi:hypothetical protein [Merismopedia glauca]|uniref:Uncharacterized protein n=1 Tax=Merismopedia glauca CCAP 1448/3 TaxID=1296344 RepID=A0A2T1C9R8_9CYAN|nr:hypothetical protein [Merismopedia glauca]PSB05010.1 hypothetical protein C7B64_01215 [Merismopedia glauca CCAP 1448/3]
MNPEYPVPDPDKVKQTIARSRRCRLEMELAGLQLEELISQLDLNLRQQRLERIKQIINGSPIESQVLSH